MAAAAAAATLRLAAAGCCGGIAGACDSRVNIVHIVIADSAWATFYA